MMLVEYALVEVVVVATIAAAGKVMVMAVVVVKALATGQMVEADAEALERKEGGVRVSAEVTQLTESQAERHG